jgi:hypothetical protein
MGAAFRIVTSIYEWQSQGGAATSLTPTSLTPSSLELIGQELTSKIA